MDKITDLFQQEFNKYVPAWIKYNIRYEKEERGSTILYLVGFGFDRFFAAGPHGDEEIFLFAPIIEFRLTEDDPVLFTIPEAVDRAIHLFLVEDLE